MYDVDWAYEERCAIEEENEYEGLTDDCEDADEDEGPSCSCGHFCDYCLGMSWKDFI